MGEVRKIEETVGETGVGIENRTEVTYQFGADIDGVFVPFISKPGTYVDRVIADARAAETAPEPTTETPETTEPDPTP